PGYLNRFFVNKRYLGKYVTSGKRHILEIGSANGAFSFWLSRNRKNTVVGLDVDKNLVRDCEYIRGRVDRDNLSFVCADAADSFAWENMFDVVVSTHVLEHVLDDKAVLANAFKALKRGGVLLLQVPYGALHKSPSREGLDNGHVRDGYTEMHLRHQLEALGFEILTIGGSVGIIGRSAYKFARGAAKGKFIFNLSVMAFPLTLVLIYLEQIVAFLRGRELPFEYSPFIEARRPL
ncbi:MAG: class I SAM-dependent methyltransferase, partial [Candidatus Omnitrophota bacterium]